MLQYFRSFLKNLEAILTTLDDCCKRLLLFWLLEMYFRKISAIYDVLSAKQKVISAN